MRKAAYLFVLASVLISGTAFSADDKGKRGGPPRPAEKPPEYSCVLLDLETEPGVVRTGERIHSFLLKYRCREKTRPVDIEVWHEGGAVGKQIVKVATDVVLEKGEHTIRLTGGDPASGGRYVTQLKADAPAGKKDIVRRVDDVVCTGWSLASTHGKQNVAGGCEIGLDTEPHVFKTGERIRKFILKTKCDELRTNKDIKVYFDPKGRGKKELVTVHPDTALRKGEQTTTLEGGGVGGEGYYVLEIPGVTTGFSFETVCSGWTLSKKK
ncbi:MAG: hypothetical protein HY896_07475 [Deltaproteobacteria bacterium]|nr:hypothetical protein [Deltaproteobacteria bacterium]